MHMNIEQINKWEKYHLPEFSSSMTFSLQRASIAEAWRLNMKKLACAGSDGNMLKKLRKSNGQFFCSKARFLQSIEINGPQGPIRSSSEEQQMIPFLGKGSFRDQKNDHSLGKGDN